jgi:hypothetical protein
MRYLLIFCLFFTLNSPFFAQVTISIDPTKDVKTISPNIYGRNNSLPKDFGVPITATQLTLLSESGVQFLREGGGNNSTKYNWKKRISSHPDWYNNVYSQDWDHSVKQLRDNLPASVTGMWTFQLTGKAATNATNNFNDWGYNGSQWWSGVLQNLAGGGVANPSGGTTATTNGNTSLYLQNWNADSTTDILPHWFNTLGIPQSRATYWNMDNEPDIWNGTHDDIIATSYAAETYMQSYFATAKKARTKFPAIKLVGPVPANEWQWFNWMNRITGSNEKYYPWLEFFIKRCAEEQTASGVRLLDVLDIHFYPTETAASDIVQMHRVFFDRTYNYAGANGVKSKDGGWDNTQTKEYIFGRINDWLVQYMGPNHGVKLGLTEMDVESSNPAVVSTWYASMLGEFMKNDVELFSPWTWKTGMWETLHLFSRYNKTQSCQGISTDETNVSAYPSVNATKTAMTVVLVNRSTTATTSTTLNFANFAVSSAVASVLRLSGLPASETFVSHTQNALQQTTSPISGNSTTISLPPLSVTSLTFSGNAVLPLELIDFQAIANEKNQSTALNWQVALATNLSDFTIQRSADGKQFEDIGTVAAKNGPLSINYFFDDKNPIKGVNYYRLKINELNGSFDFSKIKTAIFDAKTALVVVPNPTSDFISINNSEGFESLNIYDVQGRLVHQFLTNDSKFNIGDLPNGVYEVALKAKGIVSVAKIIKQ